MQRYLDVCVDLTLLLKVRLPALLNMWAHPTSLTR